MLPGRGLYHPVSNRLTCATYDVLNTRRGKSGHIVRLMLIAQYRFAAGETLLESQAGIFEPSEVPLACGRRELIDRTGYRAVHWCPMGTIYASPGFCDEMQHLFVASGLVPTHGAADEDEMLVVKQLSVEDLEQAIASRAFVDVKSIAAYTRLKLQGVLGGMSA
jgi:ADP-ribose pyrophosphatase